MTEPEQMRPMVAHPIEGSGVHFRLNGRCMAAWVVDVLAENPLDPDFKVDLTVAQPRQRRKDRFTDNNSLPGSWRWANNVSYAPVEDDEKMTWHWIGRGCVPEVVLRGE